MSILRYRRADFFAGSAGFLLRRSRSHQKHRRTGQSDRIQEKAGKYQVGYGAIRRSSASPRPPSDGTASAPVWLRPGRRQARHAHILKIGLPDTTMKPVDAWAGVFLIFVRMWGSVWVR